MDLSYLSDVSRLTAGLDGFNPMEEMPQDPFTPQMEESLFDLSPGFQSMLAAYRKLMQETGKPPSVRGVLQLGLVVGFQLGKKFSV